MRTNRSSVSKRLNKQAQILALHGYTGCGEDFTKFSPLCGSEYSWTCPDLPGHGPAPRLDCSPESVVDFIQSHRLDRPRVLLGYSMGARAALLHALAHPRHWEAVVLISGNPGIETIIERHQRLVSDHALAEKILNHGVPNFLDAWQQTPMIRSQQNIRVDWRTDMLANRLQQTAAGLAQSLQQFGLASCPNLWPTLAQLSCPTLIISGELDTKYSLIAQRMAQTLAQAKWVSIPRVGHMPHLEAPEATASAVRNFLSELFV